MSVTPPDHFSASAWSKWDTCPRQWASHYIDGVREPASAAMEIGTFAHAVFEVLMQGDPASRDVGRARRLAADIWDHLAETHPEAFGSIARGEITEREFKAQAWRSITGLWEIEDPRVLDVVATEHEVRWNERDVPMVVKIDLIERCGPDTLTPGLLRVDDFKTGAHKAKYQAPYKRQITIGALAVASQDAPLGPLTLAPAGSLLYVGESVPLAVAAPTDRNAREAVSEALQGVWADINRACADEEFPANAGPLCSWCHLAAECPEGRSYVRRALSSGWVTEDAPGAKLVAAYDAA